MRDDTGRLDSSRRPQFRNRASHLAPLRCAGAATTRRRSAHCICSTASRTSPTSKKLPVVPPSAITYGFGVAPRTGCFPADTRWTGSRPEPTTRASGCPCSLLQVTHKIEEDTDIERDYIVETVKKGSPEVDVEVIDNFSTGYHSRNGGGDLIITDGDLPIIDVRHINVPEISNDRTHRQPRQAACADRFRSGGSIFPRTGASWPSRCAVILCR